MGSIPPPPSQLEVRRVAIIGAGPSGLATAKYLVAEGCFEKIDIFEQQAEVGGIWHYTPLTGEGVPVPSTTPDVSPEEPMWLKDSDIPLFSNPMYENLHVNISKGLMDYSDQAFPSESLFFPTRQDIQEYLIRYSQDIRHLISFSTQVGAVRLSHGNGKDCWEVTSKSMITGESRLNEYDAVVVANGHFSVPFIPTAPGIEAFNSAYPAVISHAKIFRTPDEFANKKVIVVGNGASGLDIGAQISAVCRKPLLNSVKSETPPMLVLETDESKEEVPPIVEYLVDQRGVRFEDGRIEKDVDAIVYCTGYLYSYPFLTTVEPPIVTHGRRVVGLYQHLFNIVHPTLVFPTLQRQVIPFPVAEVQGAAIAKVWSNKLHLPAKGEMEAWEEAQVEEMGDGIRFHALPHPKDAEYMDAFGTWVRSALKSGGKKPPPVWTPAQFRLRALHSTLRRKFIEGGRQAKTIEELGVDIESYGYEKGS